MQSAAAHVEQRFGHDGVKVLVTGGSKGIGKAIVEEFARLGAQVFTCSRTEDALTAALAEWHRKTLNVQGCAADVSSEDGRAALMKAVQAHFNGELHVLVNNVGTNIRKPTIEYTADDLQNMMQANLCSAFHVSQLCHPLMAGSAVAGASIVFVSSVAGGPLAMKSGPVYAMTKAAMNQLTKNLACEWASADIRVNCVAPWYIHTELADAVLDKPEYKQNVLSRTPMKRIGRTEEVAGVVTFLASNAASYITGQTIAIDGGYSVMGLQ